MIPALLFLPIVVALAVVLARSSRLRHRLLIGTAALHSGMTASCWLALPQPALAGWLSLDALGLLFLSLTSLVFLATAFYASGYLNREDGGRRTDFIEGVPFANAPEGLFIALLLVFLATMTLVSLCQRFGLLWVAVEATTLTSAPLIYFHRHHRSLEATWRYLLICSVGIAIALLGNFFLAVSATRHGFAPFRLTVQDLVAHGRQLHPLWLKLAFIFMLVGYGTKMGLAPLHTWKPDAYAEAPSAVSALLAGALSNCAFLAILRVLEVCVAADLASFCQPLLLAFGLLSMAVAAAFVVAQQDYKRLLAFSSIEHMGILAIGVGLGGLGPFGALLHSLNHALTKAALFFVTGNIAAAYQSRQISDVHGLRHLLPVSGLLWLLGFLAITGTPPFGTFASEVIILQAAFAQHRFWLAGAYLGLLALIVVAMSRPVLTMTLGAPVADWIGKARPEAWSAILPPLALLLLVLGLGIWLPPDLSRLIHVAARQLGGQ
ncbi:MAG: NADH dehydrogenase FAD-containing subunit [Candidatus Sericytochromatia bacterium]|nr:NADH dehydrogenase FAD-containing subunit [Candidatus Sericytochromatia bacterium]